ncbi:hypothetical protein [Agromyces albus]|uniref:hypothetical protein n=1 Tax=Agromyces albus TaxID=205332 RepID=UPI0013E900AA|nr:hypothetical protein [Agromyces albus]
MSGDAEMESDGVLGLLVAWALWMVRGDVAPTAVDAATRALVQGVDSGPLRSRVQRPT